MIVAAAASQQQQLRLPRPAGARAARSHATASTAPTAAALRRRRKPFSATAIPRAGSAAANAAAASPAPPPPAATAVLPLPIVPTRDAPDDPLVRPPLVLNRRLRAHPLDAAAAALAAAGNRLLGQPLALSIDRHPAIVAGFCLVAALLAALGVSAGGAASAALDNGGLAMAVPAWTRRLVFLASETGGAAELPWLGLGALLLSAPLTLWAAVRCWWLGSTDACYSALLQLQHGGGQTGKEADGAAGARLLAAWLLTAARLALLSRLPSAAGAAWHALAAGGLGAAWHAVLASTLLVAVAAAPVVTCAALSLRSDGESRGGAAASAAAQSALALLALELSWLALRASQAASQAAAEAASPLLAHALAPPLPGPPNLALCAILASALAASLWRVHALSARARVDAARAAPGDAVRVHLTARLAWDGFGAGAAFDGTGRTGLGWDLDDPDRPSVPVVVQIGGGGSSGAAARGGAAAEAAATSAAEDATAGALLLRADEAARARDGAPPLTPAARLAPFGPVLAHALRGALPGERLVVRARIAAAEEEVVSGYGGSNDSTPTVRYFHPGLEALLTTTEARLLVYGRDLARSDPDVQPGDGLLLPVGGDGTGPRGAFQGLDGEIGATGRVPGVIVSVGRAGVRASGNAVLAGREVELEVRVDAVLRRDGGGGEAEEGGEAQALPRATMLLA